MKVGQHTVPASAKNIVVEAFTNTGVLWDKYKLAFKSTVHAGSELYLKDDGGKKEFGYQLDIAGTTYHPTHKINKLAGGYEVDYSQLFYPEYSEPPKPPCSEILKPETSPNSALYRFQNSCDYSVNYSLTLEINGSVKKNISRSLPSNTYLDVHLDFDAAVVKTFKIVEESILPSRGHGAIQFDKGTLILDNNLASFNFKQPNNLESVSVPKGFIAAIYPHENFVGESVNLNEGTHTNFKFPPKSISLRPDLSNISNETPFVMFDQPNFEGKNLVIWEEAKEVLLSNHQFDKKLSSFYLKDGWQVSLFNHNVEKGAVKTFYGPKLISLDRQYTSWNYQASMIYLKKTPDIGMDKPALVTYPTSDFFGREARFYSEVSNGALKEQFQSFQLRAGWFLKLEFNDQTQAQFIGPVKFSLLPLNKANAISAYSLYFVPDQIDNFANVFSVSMFSEETLYTGQFIGLLKGAEFKTNTSTHEFDVANFDSMNFENSSKSFASSSQSNSTSLFSEANYGGTQTNFEGETRSKNVSPYRIKSMKLSVNSSPVVVFEEPNFGGQVVYLGHQDISGIYEMIPSIGSFKIADGYTVRFFNTDDFTGDYYTRDSKSKDASSSHSLANQMLRSAKIYSPDSTPLIIFSDSFGNGEKMTLLDSNPNLGHMNKKMSSYQIAPDHVVRFYEEPNYQGGYYTRVSDASDAGFAEGFNDVVQSVEVFTPDSMPVTIYENANFQGKKLQLISSSPNLGEMNNKMSSFKVGPGYEAIFYEKPDFQGGYYTRRSNAGDASHNQGFNDKIQSVIIRKVE